MPAKDTYHNAVKSALEKDGWTITDDPLTLRWGGKDLFVDLGAEKILAAQKNDLKIAVEVKSFLGPSQINELEKGLGQYILYLDILARIEPDRNLYLAIREETFSELFAEPIGQLLIENDRLRLLVVDPEKEVIVQWIP